MMKILPSFGPIALGPIHKARIQKSEQEVEFTRQFLESIKLELEMRVADKSDPLWQRQPKTQNPDGS